MRRELQLGTVDGFHLATTHHMASKQPGKSVVIWMHGITADQIEPNQFFKKGISHLARNGIDSIAFDFRGHGESSGTPLDFSIIGQCTDAQTVLNYIDRYYQGVDIKLSVVAYSFGSPAALFLTQLHRDRISALTLISPVLSYDRTFFHAEADWGQRVFSLNAQRALPEKRHIMLNPKFPISIRLVEEMKVISPENWLALISKKVTIIHGASDSAVACQISRDMAKKYPEINFIERLNMEHGFLDATDKKSTSQKSIENRQFIYDYLVMQAKNNCELKGVL